MAAVVLAILLDHALIGAEIAKPGFKNTDPRPVHRLSAHTEDGPDRWVIALDEVAWSDGGRPVRFERIPDQTSLAALRGWMAAAESTSGPAPSLVLYDESGNDSDMSRAVATREVVVTLSRGTSPQSVALALGAEYKGELAYAPGTHRFLAVTALEALNAAETLYKHAGIVAVRPQIARWREPTAVPDDPLYKDQWHLRNTGQADGPNDLDLNVESAWDTVRGRGVVIGIVDSGLIADHPDLSTNVQEDLGYDFRDGDDDPSPFLGMPNTFYYYKMRALSGVGDSAFSETINVRTYSQYEAWKDGHRIATDAPEDEDSDDDKIPLFLEYALDLNPRHVSTGGLPRVDYADGQVILRYFRARNDLQYQVEESADLNTWSPVGVVQEADVLGLFITAALDLPASGRHFLRLVVSE